MINEHEAAARQQKVDALVNYLTNVVKYLTNDDDPSLLLEVAEDLDPEHWVTAAEQAGVNPPSSATIAAVQAHLRGRVEAIQDQPDDPFKNL